MYTKIWVPGQDTYLDSLFDELRIKVYESEHRLHANYTREHFEGCSALTITFTDDHEPFLCSSVLNRTCWPSTAYRISNRLWKPNPQDRALSGFSRGTDSMLITQIAWLKQNTNCELVFSSREGDKWQDWAQRNLKQQFNLEFNSSPYRYLTCDDCENPGCWQLIIYQGDERVLEKWRKL